MDNDVTITRLGVVQPGDNGSSWKGNDVNDPAPIVLMTADGPPAVFYFGRRTSNVNSSVDLRLERLKPAGGNGFFESSGDSPFPLTVSGVAEKKSDELQIDFFAPDMIGADLNGDGNEELILPRSQGNVAVLSPDRQLFEFRAPGIPKNFHDFSVATHMVVRQGVRDTVFLVMNRQIHGNTRDLPAEARQFYEETANSYLLRIDRQGITSLELEGLDRKTRRIVAVGALERDEASGIDELVVCTTSDKDGEMSVARYNPQGGLLAPPRAFYAENMPNPHLRFTYVPGSGTTLAYSAYTQKVYFITPEKSVNWIRPLDLQRLFPADGPQAEYLGAHAGPQGPLALLRRGRSVYALDDSQRFYHWQGDFLLPGQPIQALLTLPEESPQHELSYAQLISHEGKPALLTIQDRAAQPNALTDEEVEDAARRFLLPREYDHCAAEAELTFSKGLAAMASVHCRRHGLDCPPFTTLDGIRKHVPEFYETKIKSAALDRRNCMMTRLFRPLAGEGFTRDSVNDATYNQPEAYLRWLDQQQLSAELVIGLTALNGATLERRHVQNHESLTAGSTLNIPEHAFRATRERRFLVTALRETGNGTKQRPAYYLISW